MSLIKAFTVLLLLLAGASAVTYIANTSDGKMLLASEGYTAKLDLAGNRLDIGNILSVYQFPKVIVLSEELDVMEPSMGSITPGEDVRELILIYPAALKNDVYVSSRIDFREKYIHHELEIENTHASKLQVRVRLSPSTNDSYYVYAPFKANPSMNYMWVSSPYNQERGLGVAIYFDTVASDYIQVDEVSLEKNPLRFFQWDIDILPGETKVISMTYIVGYAADAELMSQHAFNPPTTKQHLLDTDDDLLFDLMDEDSLKPWRTEIGASSPNDIVEKAKTKLDQLMDTPTSETDLTTAEYNFRSLIEKSQLDSLEKSLVFREIVRKKGIPAELRIGMKGRSYYAWVYAYPTIEPFVYDPAGKMGEYDEVYVEPNPVYCDSNLGSCNWAAGLETDNFCLFNFCISVYIIIAVVLLFVVGTFFILQYKADFFYRIIRGGSPTTEGKATATSYRIIKKDHVTTNPLEEAVFRELNKRMGLVELASYEKETGFSKMLVRTALEELESKGVIKKQ